MHFSALIRKYPALSCRLAAIAPLSAQKSLSLNCIEFDALPPEINIFIGKIHELHSLTLLYSSIFRQNPTQFGLVQLFGLESLWIEATVSILIGR
jgi:hypothetical protein